MLFLSKYRSFLNQNRVHTLEARPPKFLGTSNFVVFDHPYKANYCDEGEMEPFPHIQTLRNFPREELVEKVVMVRFDSPSLLREQELDQSSQSVSSAVFTIKYLHEAGAKIILVSNWRKKTDSQLHDAESVADWRGNLHDKAAALHFLVSRCDRLVLVGMMSFQIMHALGLSVPSYLVEPEAYKAALDIIQIAHDRNIPILYPKDFWCMNEHLPEKMDVFPSHRIMDGWLPVDLGPRSLDEINSLLVKCKKILWIGPVKFKFSGQCANGASKLAQTLNELSQRNCDIIVVGNMACKAMVMESKSVLVTDMIENASVVWEFLKGRKLPGVMALDRAYPFEIDWKSAYSKPAQPLVVDIGSGSGLFLLEMARRRKDLNFLGLEINTKLARRCMDSANQYGIQNGYFIATNATSTFRSIVSSYPGELVLVSIQCPNPDFNNPEHRWRMLQRSLIKAVVDLLALDGKIFLQSDIEAVALRMKELFLKNGKGKLNLCNDQFHAKLNGSEWLEENPFGVMSDWEQHVVDRGDPMYRLMLFKSSITE